MPESQINEPGKISRLSENILRSKWFTYFFTVGLLVYIIICGYIMVFAGSLLLESISQGWYQLDSTEYEAQSLMLGYLYGFPSILGVIGGLLVLSTRATKMYKFKILFFAPSAVWSTMLVIGNLKWGLTYWTQWLFLVPVMVLSLMILFGVVKKISIPYFAKS